MELILQYRKTQGRWFHFFNPCFKFSFLIRDPSLEIWSLTVENTETRKSDTFGAKLWEQVSHLSLFFDKDRYQWKKINKPNCLKITKVIFSWWYT